ncbi:V-type proton ATPase subunit C [Scaptodrosophila lebanonensis]|uniref:V-type proton ATPase subunit C n=1 Tax=Drosophila lebanonensis TaxID=7225 RepID=A0A6J2UFX0_DROLE|nr:V-type proton ATPase subunit C [Scaptodrosophila lebanonensis]
MMSEYWIISAPGDKTCQQTFDTMNNLTSKQHNLCNNYKFHIPDLKVGTLDQLVGLSDDLGKLDTYVEQITRKVANYLGEVLEDQRDKLHENLLANNSPGPPDDSMPCRHHQRLKHLSLRHHRKHQHTHHQNNPLSYHHNHHRQLPTDLKGKSSNLTHSRATATTTSTTTHTYHAIAVTTACPTCPVSGGSLNNLSTSNDELEREFDYVIAPACACDDCYAAGSSVFPPPSTSATASTLVADECYSQTASSMLNATRSAISTVAAIATGSMGGASTSAAAAAAAASTTAASTPAPAKNSSASTLCSSSAYFSTSAPTTSSSVHSMSRSNSKKLNNNTCSINNNKLSFRSNSHVSQLNLPMHPHPHQQQSPATMSPPPLQSPTQKFCGSAATGDDEDGAADKGGADAELKSSNSVSDLSETFDWWFNRPKRNSKKCRYLIASHSPSPSTARELSNANINNIIHRTQCQTLTANHQSPNAKCHVQMSISSARPFCHAPIARRCIVPVFRGAMHEPGAHRRARVFANTIRTCTQIDKHSNPMTFLHQTSPTPRSSYRSLFNSLADQIYSKRSTTSQLNINNGFNLTPTHRSSPVSSCCGSSSQGRSSPDTDNGDPPEFPLSPAELPQYLTRFQWDMAKYPIKQSLRNIADIISKQIGQIDADLKTKSQAYNNLKGNLQNLEKKKTGSLLTRNLADLVKKEHFILDSEYLTTLLVIVPKPMANDWMTNYEKITDMIVPRSSQLIQEDSDYCLFNVTLFKKVAEEFKMHARERKFIVRDFVYNEEELAAGKNEMTKLMTDKKKQFGPLVRWLKVNFSEAFCALIHVKALRVFVESVLRYGLPVNFQAILIEPNKKSVKRLRDVLNQLYGHLDGASAGGHASSADNVEIPGLGFGQSEYFPYVFYKVNIDMVEQAKI